MTLQVEGLETQGHVTVSEAQATCHLSSPKGGRREIGRERNPWEREKTTHMGSGSFSHIVFHPACLLHRFLTPAISFTASMAEKNNVAVGACWWILYLLGRCELFYFCSQRAHGAGDFATVLMGPLAS